MQRLIVKLGTGVTSGVVEKLEMANLRNIARVLIMFVYYKVP